MLHLYYFFLSHPAAPCNPTPGFPLFVRLEVAVRTARGMPLRLLLLLGLFSLLLFSCAAPRGLVHHAAPGLMDWPDDAPRESLRAAIAQSIVYYRRLPATATLRYGPLAYSPQEMILSMELFLELLAQAPTPREFARGLKERFHLFESLSLTGDNLITGYFEPVIHGRDYPGDEFTTPLFTRPRNLVEIDLSLFSDNLPRETLRGRLEEGRLVPFYSRQEIHEGNPLEGEAEPLAYVNEVDLFFLQIQGSGIVMLPVGRELRVGYHSSNGHPYRSIGAQLIADGAMTREEVSMQSIREYLRDNPDKVTPLLNSNPSYIFFRPLESGPLGNINVPLTPGRSLALDHRLFPKGGLAYLSGKAPHFGKERGDSPLNRFMLVQDTGGAIRGYGRADIFWGRGPAAEWKAGQMKHPGKLLLLVAKKEFLGQPAKD